jgi:hypothetical protein
LGTKARRKADGREGLKAANKPLIAQYAPNTPKITLKIAVVPTSKTMKSAFTLTALAGSPIKHVAANI